MGYELKQSFLLFADPTSLRKKGRRVSVPLPSLDNFDVDVIQRRVYKFYEQNTLPTMAMLHSALQEEMGFEYSESSLRRLVKTRLTKFKFRKHERQNVMIEEPRIRLVRAEYLHKVRLARKAGKHLVYLDETWYDTHEVAAKGWSDQSQKCLLKMPTNQGKRLIILHAGSSLGWVPGALFLSGKNIKDSSADYHADMNSDVFEEWFTSMLVSLSEPSVIVMDNASYHSRLSKRIPTTAAKKEEIIEFLRGKALKFLTHYPQNLHFYS